MAFTGCGGDGSSPPPDPSTLTGTWLLRNARLQGSCDTIPGEGDILLTIRMEHEAGSSTVRIEVDNQVVPGELENGILRFTVEVQNLEGTLVFEAGFSVTADYAAMAGIVDITYTPVGGDTCVITGPWDGWKLDDIVTGPGETHECPSQGASTDIGYPFDLGILIGDGITFLACAGWSAIPPGTPPFPGERTSDHFQFTTIGEAQAGHQIAVTWYNQASAPGSISISLLTVEGALIATRSELVDEGQRKTRIIDLHSLPPGTIHAGQSLPAGSWILRVGRSATDVATPRYDVLFDVPDSVD